MDTELDFARAQILELIAELECERKARKKLETMRKRLAKELAEERRGREALERVCEELAREISSDRDEIDHMKREMGEEREMIRMAAVLREERVQMKLAEAKMLFEEKLLELVGTTTQAEPHQNSTSRMELIQRSRESPEPENPHIKRGMKGFVEFPRVVRAIGSKNKHRGTKLECQKAQLRILLKQKSPIRSTNLIVS
ncbi:protein BRANCHLESS TRICHOME-like [Populus alba x Populus x berolinensis]|nr:protein BRANCHLESS TRICHOME-like [Populus alba x Populus x berolinensis]